MAPNVPITVEIEAAKSATAIVLKWPTLNDHFEIMIDNALM